MKGNQINNSDSYFTVVTPRNVINRYNSLFVVFLTSRRLDRLIHLTQGQIDKRIHGGVHNHMIIQGRKKLEDRRKTRNLVQNR